MYLDSSPCCGAPAARWTISRYPMRTPQGLAVLLDCDLLVCTRCGMGVVVRAKGEEVAA